MQQVLFPTDTQTVTLPSPARTTLNRSLDIFELQRLEDRLRLAYGPVEDALPARLAELVERLARREQNRG